MRSTRRSDRNRIIAVTTAIVGFALLPCACGAAPALDERPAEPGTWGYRPGEGAASETNPPSFSWRPQQGLTWKIQCARDSDFSDVVYERTGIEYNVHCPAETFEPGRYAWRYRGQGEDGDRTAWSRVRTFRIAGDAVRLPMPERSELIDRIPDAHPRLFVRPENLAELRRLARGPMKDAYAGLVKDCDRILADPPPTAEPPKYPQGMERKSEQWREIWWGNRVYTIRALNSAATLGFTRLLGGPEKYGREAKRILLECAKWEPRGSTGYRYNDEAGMPYNYYFARTYSFVNDLLTPQEKELCRSVMQVRGQEMYDHLYPRHLWRPYSSHSNRAWHFLGEVGIAFLGEVEGAEDWVWFAANVFFNAYPVWSDTDGGWHEGSSYWASYIGRFTWWADVMREAMGIDAYRKPYFSQVGYYPMYLLPPGKEGGGFGDLTARKDAKDFMPLMSVLAAQAQNRHWQWYVEALGGPASTGGYIGFIRGRLPEVEPKTPDDLPASRLFEGTGQAYLNTSMEDADESVQVIFKSSPFGTQSHGYESNNSFLLWAYGRRLLIRSGRRDIYGSAHHRNWMWSTRSTNCITVDGQGQRKHTIQAQGEITAFLTTPEVDAVIGDASDSYASNVELFKRAILFIKPDLIVVYDRLRASKPSTCEYWLHAVKEFDIRDDGRVTVRNGDVACDIEFLAPQDLAFSQTGEYDPNPRPRVKLREWHLTASTTAQEETMEFVTVYRPRSAQSQPAIRNNLEPIPGGYRLQSEGPDYNLTALLPAKDDLTLSSDGLTTKGAIKLKLERPNQAVQIVTLRERN